MICLFGLQNYTFFLIYANKFAYIDFFLYFCAQIINLDKYRLYERDNDQETIGDYY